MKKCIAILLSSLFFFSAAANDHSIVFIHLGKSIPSYVTHAIAQSRLFNPECDIYLITDNAAILGGALSLKETKLIAAHEIPLSAEHLEFRKKTTLDRNSREGFWLHTSERFLLLHDFIKHFDLTNIFHLENDTMLYANLEALLPVFEKKYQHIGAVFDNDKRCIPCLVYIKNANASQNIAACFAKHASKGVNDMYVFGLLKKESPHLITQLPIIMPEYIETIGLKSTSGHTTKDPLTFANHFDAFNAIFDAAALGQFLGGIDPRNGTSKPGFINETCLFNPSFLTFSWEKDKQGRAVPYATFQNRTCKINTLHIHSKRLKLFTS